MELPPDDLIDSEWGGSYGSVWRTLRGHYLHVYWSFGLWAAAVNGKTVGRRLKRDAALALAENECPEADPPPCN